MTHLPNSNVNHYIDLRRAKLIFRRLLLNTYNNLSIPIFFFVFPGQIQYCDRDEALKIY